MVDYINSHPLFYAYGLPTLRLFQPAAAMLPSLDILRVNRECQDKLGVVPKPQQINVLESIHERRDCVLIAPTGWGKTLAFTLPLLLWDDAVILVITPLKVLGAEQSDKLKNLKIKCVNITEDNKEINAAKVLQGGYRAIFVSPEMLLESNRLKGLWENKKWKESVRVVVVDEAHCIDAWGRKFRLAFGELSKLRHRLDNRTPFLAVSATLPHAVLAATIKSLDLENPKCINVGNDRPNIMYKVKRFRKPMSSFEDLRFLTDKVRTIVYFDNRDLAEEAGHTLRAWFGQGQVEVYHGFKTEDLKNGRMNDFRDGKFHILLATEAAGMGCDISDIVRVVQYGYPSDINCLVQRLGRAARDGTSQGYGIFLVPKKKTTSDQDLQCFIDSPGCRRQYLNTFYGNQHNPVTVNCCDKCHQDDDEDKDEHAVVQSTDKDKPAVVQSVDKALRREKWDKAEGERVRNALTAWRSKMFEQHYIDHIHATEETPMTDNMLDKAVKKYHYVVAAGSIDILKWDPVNSGFSSQVLKIIMGLNEQFLEEKEEKEKEQAQEKERKQQSGKLPSFQIPPRDVAVTGQQETQVVATTRHSRQQSNQQGNRTKEDSQPQQPNATRDFTHAQSMDQQPPLPPLPPLPEQKTKAISRHKKRETAINDHPPLKKRELTIKQYFSPPPPKSKNQVQANNIPTLTIADRNPNISPPGAATS